MGSGGGGGGGEEVEAALSEPRPSGESILLMYSQSQINSHQWATGLFFSI